jgi:hypothetical protein
MRLKPTGILSLRVLMRLLVLFVLARSINSRVTWVIGWSLNRNDCLEHAVTFRAGEVVFDIAAIGSAVVDVRHNAVVAEDVSALFSC